MPTYLAKNGLPARFLPNVNLLADIPSATYVHSEHVDNVDLRSR